MLFVTGLVKVSLQRKDKKPELTLLPCLCPCLSPFFLDLFLHIVNNYSPSLTYIYRLSHTHTHSHTHSHTYTHLHTTPTHSLFLSLLVLPYLSTQKVKHIGAFGANSIFSRSFFTLDSLRRVSSKQKLDRFTKKKAQLPQRQNGAGYRERRPQSGKREVASFAILVLHSILNRTKRRSLIFFLIQEFRFFVRNRISPKT